MQLELMDGLVHELQHKRLEGLIFVLDVIRGVILTYLLWAHVIIALRFLITKVGLYD